MKGQTKTTATAITESAQQEEKKFNPSFAIFKKPVGYLKHNGKLIKAEIKSYSHDYNNDKTECEILLTHGEKNTETIVRDFADIEGFFYNTDNISTEFIIHTELFNYMDSLYNSTLNGVRLRSNSNPFVFKNGFPQAIELKADACKYINKYNYELTILSLQDTEIYATYDDALAYNEIIVEDENGTHTIGGTWKGSELNEEQEEAVKQLETALANLEKVGLNVVMDENENLCFLPNKFGYFGFCGDGEDDYSIELEGWNCRSIRAPFSYYCEPSVYKKKNKE